MSFDLQHSLKDVFGNYRFRDWRYIAFYFGIPLVLALYSALNNTQLLGTVGYFDTFGFYLAQSFIPYWITATCSLLVMVVLRRWKPVPIVIMSLGVFLSCFFTAPYTDFVDELFHSRWEQLLVPRQSPSIGSVEFWMFVLRAWVWWVLINVVFDRYVGLPRYRYLVPRGYEDQLPRQSRRREDSVETEKQEVQAHLPGFLERLPETVSVDQILVIKAEQHYIGIQTEERNYMVLYRFRDAVREMSANQGLQVHRSYWVSKKAIECIQSGGKKFGLSMKNGEFVPVSVPYQGVVKQLARELGLPSRPLPAGI